MDCYSLLADLRIEFSLDSSQNLPPSKNLIFENLPSQTQNMLLGIVSFSSIRRFIYIVKEQGLREALVRSLSFLRKTFKGSLKYQQWISEKESRSNSHSKAEIEISKFKHRPLFSILLPVYNPKEKWIEKSIQSVLKQTYSYWELCIVDDGSSLVGIEKMLFRYQKLDSRIKISFSSKNRGISAATNTALDLATGDYILFLDHDDELSTSALLENARLINQHPNADFIYSDEDKINEGGRRFAPFFKPDWSPEYFHGCMYTCHLSTYRTSLVREVGGLRSEYDGAQDWDLALRVTEQTSNIYHIPKILYHWRTVSDSTAFREAAKPWAYEAGHSALNEMLKREKSFGRIQALDGPGIFRVKRELLENPLVSIIIPSAGKVLSENVPSKIGKKKADEPYTYLENCVESIQALTTYQNYEVIIVDGYDTPQSLQLQLQELEHERVIRWIHSQKPFNFSERINRAASIAKGEIFILLNDDTQVITPDWIETMLELAQQAEIGAVGAKLYYGDYKIQHAGVLILDGAPCHAFHKADPTERGYFYSNIVNRNYLAVTAACLMVRRQVFEAFQGFEESFPVNYNDVDFCLKLHQGGYRNVFTPFAELFHFESASRKPGVEDRELRHFRQKWGPYLRNLGGDPYHSPNLSTLSQNFEI